MRNEKLLKILTGCTKSCSRTHWWQLDAPPFWWDQEQWGYSSGQGRCTSDSGLCCLCCLCCRLSCLSCCLSFECLLMTLLLLVELLLRSLLHSLLRFSVDLHQLLRIHFLLLFVWHQWRGSIGKAPDISSFWMNDDDWGLQLRSCGFYNKWWRRN